MICSKCGENLVKNQVFCRKCGTKVDTNPNNAVGISQNNAVGISQNNAVGISPNNAVGFNQNAGIGDRNNNASAGVSIMPQTNFPTNFSGGVNPAPYNTQGIPIHAANTLSGNIQPAGNVNKRKIKATPIIISALGVVLALAAALIIILVIKLNHRSSTENVKIYFTVPRSAESEQEQQNSTEQRE